MCLSTMNIILKDFENSNTSSAYTTWFMGGYALTVGSFILVSGRIADLYGFKKIFNIGWIWIIVWSIISGFSFYTNSIIFFIICRAFQGIGFALILPTGLGILGHIYSNGERKNFVFGCVGANGPTGACVGALMAGVVAQTWWWPWIFWLLAIFSFILLILSIVYIPHFEGDTTGNRLQKLNIPGCIIGLAGLILMNFVWTQGPVVGWNKAYIIVLLVVSVLLIAAFFVYELKFTEFPLLPKSIFNIKIGLVLACMSFGWGSFGAWQFYYWNIILNLRNYTPIEGGLTYITFLVLGCIASLLASFIISHTKPSFIISFSTICFMVGCIMLSVTPIEQSFFRLTFGMQFILAWAMDLSFPTCCLILSDLMKNNQGMAGSLVSTVVNYSVSLFLGMSTCVEIETYKHNQDQLSSYRAGLYFATGIAGLGVICSFIFIFVQRKDANGTNAFIEIENVDDSSIEKKDIENM
ncbi:ATR1 [Candida pseudojiufengensis]|uniref:ATR1 n=1 Tax=Candida pseudojiufengensis TaxID=497109 RepID=UPI002224541A|nr:ATR1 [Candida pseudojiufengensis]KAI5966463.1 ATR1 [Candida pseudojiufengensis]